MEISGEKANSKNMYMSQENLKIIVQNYFQNENFDIKNYTLDYASKNMLGFLCEYFNLSIQVKLDTKGLKEINCFLKAISKSNEAKAAMVRELELFQKELKFYAVIKEKIRIPEIQPWSPRLIVDLKDTMVFENLISLGYKMHNKLKTYDEAHTLVTLKTLARFHASTIIYEEIKSQELNRSYSINEDYEMDLNEGGYVINNTWFKQCMDGALSIVKSHSKYAKNDDTIATCDKKWRDVWNTALKLSDFSAKYRNVICHRDLWNNNMLFHYGDDNKPDDCLLVDFQAARCHPPAGDIMVLLYCNLEPSFREENMSKFLNYYYAELEKHLKNRNITINNVITLKELYKSAEEYRLWGLIISACLVPQFFIDDVSTNKIFTDSEQFNEILTKDKASFISKMVLVNESYRAKVLGIFEDIVEHYVLS